MPKGVTLQQGCINASLAGWPQLCKVLLLWRVQTAFKRSAPTSAPDTGGNGGCPEAAEVIVWDSVKPDDKILVFQVSLVSLLPPTGAV